MKYVKIVSPKLYVLFTDRGILVLVVTVVQALCPPRCVQPCTACSHECLMNILLGWAAPQVWESSLLTLSRVLGHTCAYACPGSTGGIPLTAFHFPLLWHVDGSPIPCTFPAGLPLGLDVAFIPSTPQGLHRLHIPREHS